MITKTNTLRSDRENKRLISAFVEEDVFKAFKILAAEQLSTTDGMVTKAVALLLENYGKQLPASLKKKLNSIGLGSILAPVFLVFAQI